MRALNLVDRLPKKLPVVGTHDKEEGSKSTEDHTVQEPFGDRLVAPVRPTGLAPAFLVTPILLFFCLGLIRSTVDQHPIIPENTALSSEYLAQGLALSSAYTVLFTANESEHEPEGALQHADIENVD